MESTEFARIAERLDTVETLSRLGVPFERIETEIETMLGLDPDQRSALWLYAWALAPTTELRDVVVSLIVPAG